MTDMDMSQAAWRTSSRSGNTGGDCVQVAYTANVVAVRDSKDRSGPVLAFDSHAWASFLGDLRAGELAQR
jgi:hypothetical protein